MSLLTEYYVPLPFPFIIIIVWRESVRCTFSFWMVFFVPCDRGLDFDISLCENSFQFKYSSVQVFKCCCCSTSIILSKVRSTIYQFSKSRRYYLVQVLP